MHYVRAAVKSWMMHFCSKEKISLLIRELQKGASLTVLKSGDF